MASPRWRAILGRRIIQMLEMCNTVEFAVFGAHEIRQYVALAQRHFAEFSREHQGIVTNIEDAEILRAQEAIFSDVERTYIRVQAALATQMAKFEMPSAKAARSNLPLKVSQPKPPPKPEFDQTIFGVFNGEATGWQRFQKLFETHVHAKKTIDPRAEIALFA